MCGAACSAGDANVTAGAIGSPDGGETWAVAAVDSAWLAVGPGGTYTSYDEGESWERAGPPPPLEPRLHPDPLGIAIAGNSAFLNIDGVVLRTTNLGRRWDVAFGSWGEVFAVGAAAYALHSGVLLRSPDQGSSWPDTVRTREGRIARLKATGRIVSATRRLVYLSDGYTALRSLDGGTTWDSLPGVLTYYPPPGYPGAPETLRMLGVHHAAAGNVLYALGAMGDLYSSPDRGQSWARADGRITELRTGGARLISAGGALWVSGQGRTCRLEPESLECPFVEQLPEIRGVLSAGVLAAASEEGVWRSRDGGITWTPASRGIRAGISSAIRLADGTYVAAADRRLYRGDSLSRWVPGPRYASPVHSLGQAGRTIVAFTADSVITCATDLRSCATRPVRLPGVPGGVEVRPGTAYYADGVVRTGAMLTPSLQAAVLRSDNLGRSWRIEGRPPGARIHQIWTQGAVVYAVTERGIAATGSSGERMTLVEPAPTDFSPSAFAVTPERVLVGTSASALYVYAQRGPRLQPLHHTLLGRSPVRAVWVQGGRPDALIVATDSRLSWSGDGGRTFTESRIPEGVRPEGIRSISATGRDTLLLTAENGIFRLRHHIPTPRPIARKWKKHGPSVGWKPLATVVAVLLGMGVLAWKARTRGVVLSAIGPWGMFARVVPPFIRVRIQFWPYRRFLRAEKPVRLAGERFFGLPAEGPDSVVLAGDDESRLIQAVAEASRTREPVLVTAGAGAGKTTLLNRIAWLYAHDRLPAPWRPFRVVVVHARDYHEGLLQALAKTLQRYGVDVNAESAVGLVASEPLLILFDGASDIPAQGAPDEAHEERIHSSIEDLVAAAALHVFAACRVVIASRPMDILESGFPTFTLRPLTPEHVENHVLPRYGVREPGRVRDVMRELERVGPPLMPLLVNMAVEASRDGSSTSSGVGLYERYFRRLLKIDETGGDLHWEGWKLVLSAIAAESLVRRGERGVGLRHEEAVEVLRTAEVMPGRDLISALRDTYGIRGVRIPLTALRRLHEAEILLRDGDLRVTFAHDRFEEYFAALSLIREVRDHGKWPALTPWKRDPQRKAGFVDVLRLAVELGGRALLRSTLPRGVPAAWRAVLDPSPAPPGSAPQP